MLCLVRDVFLCIAFHDHKREMLALNPVAGDSDRLNLRSFVCNFTSVRLPVLLQSPVNVDPPVVSLSPDLGPLPRMAHTFKFVHSMLLCLMLLDTRSRPSALVHSYMFVFTGTRVFHWHALMCLFSLVCIHFQLYRFIFPRMHSFSCVRVCFHSYVFVLTCTGPFTVVHVCLSYSQWYVLVLIVLSCTHSFSVICTCFQLDTHLFALVFSWMPSFSVYAFILSGTHSFSVGRTRSWLDTLVLGCTHSFLVVHTCSHLYTLVLACMHLFSPVCTRPRPHTHTP